MERFGTLLLKEKLLLIQTTGFVAIRIGLENVVPVVKSVAEQPSIEEISNPERIIYLSCEDVPTAIQLTLEKK